MWPAYFAKTKDGVPPDELVDQTTWDDLDMDQVFCSLDRCVSVVGSEVLYATLRRTGIEDADLARRERMIEELRAHDRLRLDAQEALLRVGRRHFHGATRYLCRIEHERPGWVYDLLCALPLLVCVAGLFASPALILLFPAFAVQSGRPLRHRRALGRGCRSDDARPVGIFRGAGAVPRARVGA